MHSEQHFSLCWNDHHSTLVAIFESLLESGTLVDCTIAAEGQFLKAHRVVLSACSPYFQLLLSQQNESHPIIILKDVKFQELKAMIDYIYRGEVKISENRLGDFLEAAESLQIKGLGDGNIRDGLERAGLTERPPPSSTRRGTSAPTSRKRHHSSHANYQAYMGALPPHTNLPTHPNIGEEGPQELPPIPDATMAGCDIPPPCQPSPSSLSNMSSPGISTHSYNRNPCTPMVTQVSDDGSDICMKRESLPTQMILEPKIEYLDKTVNDNCVENLTMLYDMDEMAELKTGQHGLDRAESKAGMRMHARPLRFTCAECNKAFPRASQLKIHQRTHTGERPYTCDVCTAAFKKSGDLKIHKRLHTGERPYPCSLCERAFISNSDLHKHKRVHGITPAPSTRSSAAAAAAAAAAVAVELLAQVTSPGACSAAAAAAAPAAPTPSEAPTLS